MIWGCADGSHFLMQFDTSPGMIKEMDQQLNRDPLVIRWTMLKKGTKLYVDRAMVRKESILMTGARCCPRTHSRSSTPSHQRGRRRSRLAWETGERRCTKTGEEDGRLGCQGWEESYTA